MNAMIIIVDTMPSTNFILDSDEVFLLRKRQTSGVWFKLGNTRIYYSTSSFFSDVFSLKLLVTYLFNDQILTVIPVMKSAHL